MTIVFESQQMRTLLRQASRFATSSATVLILGESGTGKELVARFLHDNGPRMSRPCIRVNCAALHEGLAESELFGHEHGAFTGAVREHEGCISAAANGTLFLDEIAELPLIIQAKLLRALEENEYCRVGSTQLLKMNARIIAATNRDLMKEIELGRFRGDLFHRLDVLTLRVPALRDRPEDIPVLANLFVQQFQAEGQAAVTAVSEDVMQRLKKYHWPGNIRQLRNVIHRACIVSESSTIQDVEIPHEGQQTTDDGLPAAFHSLPLKEIERQVIMARLERFQGNKTEAAAELGVTARTLRNKVAMYRRERKAA
jgi:two-component system, NtrC family, response regulator HydG